MALLSREFVESFEGVAKGFQGIQPSEPPSNPLATPWQPPGNPLAT